MQIQYGTMKISKQLWKKEIYRRFDWCIDWIICCERCVMKNKENYTKHQKNLRFIAITES